MSITIEIINAISNLLIQNRTTAFFIISVILIGNILRNFLLKRKLEDLGLYMPSFDTFSLYSGLLVTIITLFFRDINTLNFNLFLEWKTFALLGIITFFSVIIIKNYEKYGKKYITDGILIVIATIFAGIFLYAGINSIIEGFTFKGFINCIGLNCKINFIIDKLFKIVLAIILFISGIKLFKFINKERRYREKK